ncbi:hypothetical protein Tco_1440714 [Tanacetum coccineum]
MIHSPYTRPYGDYSPELKDLKVVEPKESSLEPKDEIPKSSLKSYLSSRVIDSIMGAEKTMQQITSLRLDIPYENILDPKRFPRLFL